MVSLAAAVQGTLFSPAVTGASEQGRAETPSQDCKDAEDEPLATGEATQLLNA